MKDISRLDRDGHVYCIMYCTRAVPMYHYLYAGCALDSVLGEYRDAQTGFLAPRTFTRAHSPQQPLQLDSVLVATKWCFTRRAIMATPIQPLLHA